MRQSWSEQLGTRHLQLSHHCSSLGEPLLSQLGIWGPCPHVLHQDVTSLSWAGTGHQPPDFTGLVGPGVPVGGGRVCCARGSAEKLLIQQTLSVLQQHPHTAEAFAEA